MNHSRSSYLSLANVTFFTGFLFLAIFGFLYFKNQNQTLEIDTIHGHLSIHDPLAIELIQSPPMQRLKHIRQYGTGDYSMRHRVGYNRFDHSLGVYYLLQKHGASRTEQIAGLLHDISHTVFSHATDPLFMGDQLHGAYQDTIHEQFLKKYGIESILQKYELMAHDVVPKNEHFRALEQDAPALCADRIEYNIYAAYMDNLLTTEDLQEIHTSLHFDGHDWYFDTPEAAKKFASIPLHQSMYMWGAPSMVLSNNWISKAFRIALDEGIVDKEEIWFTMTDDQMWEKLSHIDHPEIQKLLHNIVHCEECYAWATDTDINAEIVKAKFRGVDPLIKTAHGLLPLTQLDAAFNEEFLKVKNIMQQGWKVVLLDEPKPHDHHHSFDPRKNSALTLAIESHNSAQFIHAPVYA